MGENEAVEVLTGEKTLVSRMLGAVLHYGARGSGISGSKGSK